MLHADCAAPLCAQSFACMHVSKPSLQSYVQACCAPNHVCVCVPHLQGSEQLVCLPTSCVRLADAASAIAGRKGVGSFIRPTI